MEELIERMQHEDQEQRRKQKEAHEEWKKEIRSEITKLKVDIDKKL